MSSGQSNEQSTDNNIRNLAKAYSKKSNFQRFRNLGSVQIQNQINNCTINKSQNQQTKLQQQRENTNCSKINDRNSTLKFHASGIQSPHQDVLLQNNTSFRQIKFSDDEFWNTSPRPPWLASLGYGFYVFFWGHAPRPPGLASLEAMGSVHFFLFVVASQSHGGAGGWPPANPGARAQLMHLTGG
ncbi:hypothetical protein TRICI_004520 [Trichomonascus ciferrii]|uniref:Uncharacterized protein n=1 Tax=Trichomonascus ciferrii TaxID=44093 RepID=A0A642V5L4_9ASCO|nr:hypothetical protein TRICI_004520 [Trichomonascus ciferrii]